jgi:two-component system chemotaxis response regulator CheY
MPGKVLIVDDAAFMRMVIKDILTKNGFEVVGEKMEGIDALKAIMEYDPNAKVVMCSSIGQQSIVSDAITIGARDFIVKPFDAVKVLEVIQKVL